MPTTKVKTAVAARLLGVMPARLYGLMRAGKIDPLPERDSSGDYWWDEEDLERARQAMSSDRRRRKMVAAEEGPNAV